ncbi:hypothetical protein [Mycolicibacterium aromaticivorans]|uniref:hypothetical protein n=1 Tax=Mycolicibacterium aromaticivorans TaxID=318425 RepID=UPI001040B3AB|nr:hypothetical protein [Mycolicibacterium aromaticivorans]
MTATSASGAVTVCESTEIDERSAAADMLRALLALLALLADGDGSGPTAGSGAAAETAVAGLGVPATLF